MRSTPCLPSRLCIAGTYTTRVAPCWHCCWACPSSPTHLQLCPASCCPLWPSPSWPPVFQCWALGVTRSSRSQLPSLGCGAPKTEKMDLEPRICMWIWPSWCPIPGGCKRTMREKCCHKQHRTRCGARLRIFCYGWTATPPWCPS